MKDVIRFRTEAISMKRICKDCGIEKDITEYYFRKERGIYRLECKPCWTSKNYTKQKARLASDPVKAETERMRCITRFKERWDSDPVFKAHRKALQIKFNNSEKGKAAKSASDKRYRATENGKEAAKRGSRIYNLRSRAAGEVCWDDVMNLISAQNSKCYYCDDDLDGQFHVDHKIPVSRGGSSDKENLAITCPHCNRSKGAKTDTEFIAAKKVAFNSLVSQR